MSSSLKENSGTVGAVETLPQPQERWCMVATHEPEYHCQCIFIPNVFSYLIVCPPPNASQRVTTYTHVASTHGMVRSQALRPHNRRGSIPHWSSSAVRWDFREGVRVAFLTAGFVLSFDPRERPPSPFTQGLSV
jgi:hypothetical protein